MAGFTSWSGRGQWFWMKAHKRLRNAFIRRLYRDPGPEFSRTILLAGAARSGTTWLADLIGAALPSRVMFEPFTPARVAAYPDRPDFVYRRSRTTDTALRRYAARVFSGRIRDPWIDREVDQLHSHYRLVKAVRVNLILHWLHRRFPEVPFVLLLRHPCAVVLSRLEAGWGAADDLAALAAQPDLRHDFIGDRLERVRRMNSPAAEHAFIWAVQQAVPWQTLPAETLARRVVYYEHLCTDPTTTLSAVFTAIGQPYQPAVLTWVDRPSRTASTASAVIRGGDKVRRWQGVLSTAQIDDIIGVTEMFELQHLYRRGPLPVAGVAA